MRAGYWNGSVEVVLQDGSRRIMGRLPRSTVRRLGLYARLDRIFVTPSQLEVIEQQEEWRPWGRATSSA